MLAAARIPALPSPPQPDRAATYSSETARYERIFSSVGPENRLPPIAGSIERLPSVSQLLTPASQGPSHPGPSAYYDRPDRRVELPSPHPRTPSEILSRPATSYFHTETLRDQSNDPRSVPTVPHSLNASSDTSHRAYGSSITSAPAPLQLQDPSNQGHPHHQPVIRTPTTWPASQSPQSVASNVPRDPGTGTPISKVLEKQVASRKLLGEQSIPGEGRVYVYDDGTKIPTHVDGEPVNGQWGMTKAGKPRKRMPQACIACRQKKIKCDPGENKCAQCEKSGKDCKYTEGQRGHKSSASSPSRNAGPDTPSSERQNFSPRFATTSIAGRKRSASVDLVKAQHKRLASADDILTPRRTNIQQNWTASLTDDDRSRLIPGRLSYCFDGKTRNENTCDDRWASDTEPDGMVLDDPFRVDPDRAAYYLNRFFLRVNHATYMIFPKNTMEAWARSSRIKSRGEVTTLYGLLACGCLFSDRPDAKRDSEVYIRAVMCGIDSAPKRQGMLLVLGKVVMGHYYFTLGDFTQVLENNDTCRAVSMLPRDLEARLKRPDSDGRFEFGMNSHALGELHRRLQWIGFVVDRFISNTMGFPICYHKKDIFLRLPCDNEAYDRGDATHTPYFDNGILGRKYLDEQPGDTPLSIWAYFIQGMSFDTDIRGEAQRSLWQDEDVYPGNYDAWAKRQGRDLDTWHRNLPSDLHFNDANIDRHLHANTLGLLFAIHGLYHMCQINLNRRVRANLLPQNNLLYNSRASQWHAKHLILKADGVRRSIDAETNRVGREPEYQPSPFLSYALLSSMDILTCSGLTDGPTAAEALEFCEQGLEAIAKNAVWYSISRGQLLKLERRVEEIRNVIESARRENAAGSKGADAWICIHPMLPNEPSSMDIFYEVEGGVRSVILLDREIKVDEMRVEYLEKDKLDGMVDPTPKTVWVGT